MKFQIATAAALVAGANAAYKNGGDDSYVTTTVTALTTYCPEATQLTHNGQTYTVTEATTLTITNCPCTISYPATTTTAAPTSSAPVYTTSVAPTSSAAPTTYSAAPSSYSSSAAPSSYSSAAPTSAAPSSYSSSAAPSSYSTAAPTSAAPSSYSTAAPTSYVVSNATTPITSYGTAAPTTASAKPSQFTGAANKAAPVAGVAAIMGAAALFL